MRAKGFGKFIEAELFYVLLGGEREGGLGMLLDRRVCKRLGEETWSDLYGRHVFDENFCFFGLGRHVEDKLEQQARRVAHAQKIRKLAGAGSKQRDRGLRKALRG